MSNQEVAEQQRKHLRDKLEKHIRDMTESEKIDYLLRYASVVEAAATNQKILIEKLEFDLKMLNDHHNLIIGSYWSGDNY